MYRFVLNKDFAVSDDVLEYEKEVRNFVTKSMHEKGFVTIEDLKIFIEFKSINDSDKSNGWVVYNRFSINDFRIELTKNMFTLEQAFVLDVLAPVQDVSKLVAEYEKKCQVEEAKKALDDPLRTTLVEIRVISNRLEDYYKRLDKLAEYLEKEIKNEGKRNDQ